MATVRCEITEIQLIDNRDGMTRPGVMATCPKCGLFTESFGTGPKSIARCLVLLKQGCDSDEENYYARAKADEFGETGAPGSDDNIEVDEWFKRTGRR